MRGLCAIHIIVVIVSVFHIACEWMRSVSGEVLTVDGAFTCNGFNFQSHIQDAEPVLPQAKQSAGGGAAPHATTTAELAATEIATKLRSLL